MVNMHMPYAHLFAVAASKFCSPFRGVALATYRSPAHTILGGLLVTVFICVMTVQTLNYNDRYELLPPHVASELSLPPQCQQFLFYPNYFATLGIPAPPDGAMEAGVFPSKRSIKQKQRHSNKCWHPDKIQRYHKLSSGEAATIQNWVSDAATKLLEGEGVPRRVDESIMTPEELQNHKSMGLVRNMPLVETEWWQTPAPGDAPQFDTRCECSLNQAFVRWIYEIITPYWLIRHTCESASALFKKNRDPDSEPQACARCTFSLAYRPYTQYFTLSLSTMRTGFVDLSTLPTYRKSLQVLAKRSWFWAYIYMVAGPGQAKWKLESSDFVACVEDGWCTLDDMQAYIWKLEQKFDDLKDRGKDTKALKDTLEELVKLLKWLDQERNVKFNANLIMIRRMLSQRQAM